MNMKCVGCGEKATKGSMKLPVCDSCFKSVFNNDYNRYNKALDCNYNKYNNISDRDLYLMFAIFLGVILLIMFLIILVVRWII